MRLITFIAIALLLSSQVAHVEAQERKEAQCFPIKELFKSKRQKAKEEREAAEKMQQPSEEEKKYQDLVKEAVVDSGLVVTHLKENKLYFELPDSIFGKPLLLSNRISQTSNPQAAVAGEMVTEPFMIRLSKREKQVYIHTVQSHVFVDEDDPISASFARNYQEPILLAFDIKAENGSNVVIDVTRFFLGGESSISPIKDNYLVGGPVSDASFFTSVHSFPQNVEVKSVMGFRNEENAYTIEAHRSLVLLPEDPMQMRLQDNRVGYFSSPRSRFTSSLDKMDDFRIIHRWRLEPSDTLAYNRGELVPPKKPIVFYVDTAFPPKWREAILLGVTDWNRAFEAAGFKDAITARLYPSKEEMPDFDPDDLRFSCIKYATSHTPNAMGPSYIDPRSGEILNADVIWYHNVISRLHSWRFTQTAAADTRVRQHTFPDDVMAESMRHVAAHEIGHTLGLMHNMGASYAIAVEYLRSPEWTQKYGITASIMDYTRYNFVAQPGDKERGVVLTPPHLGVYDIHAINWGYRYIPEATSYRDERPILNSWIEAKLGDPMYEFGAQQAVTLDPTDQTEDLGDDHMRAGDYGIANLKYIVAHYEEWLYEEGKRTDDLETAYKEIQAQFLRHLMHVTPYIGGRIYYENRQGDGELPVSYVPKAKQQEALHWVLKQLRESDQWLFTNEHQQKYDSSIKLTYTDIKDVAPRAVVQELYAGHRLLGVMEGYVAKESTDYSIDSYLDELTKAVFSKSYAGSKLSEMDRAIESEAIQMMIYLSELRFAGGSGDYFLVADNDELWESLLAPPTCMHQGNSDCHHARATGGKGQSFYRNTFMPAQPPKYEIAPRILLKLEEVRSLYRRRIATTSDPATKGFYKLWDLQLTSLLDPQ